MPRSEVMKVLYKAYIKAQKDHLTDSLFDIS